MTATIQTVRVSGIDYAVRYSSMPSGRTLWSLKTLHGRAFGVAESPEAAAAEARDWLQLQPSPPGSPEESLAAALRASGLLARGGVRKFARRSA